jgi:hypothetical protein
MKKLAIETIVPALVGVGLIGYVLFRVARGAFRSFRGRIRRFAA